MIVNRQALRREMFEEQKGACWLCGGKMVVTENNEEPLAATFDHVKARVFGGSDDRENLRLAHSKCNSARGHGTARKLPELRPTGIPPKNSANPMPFTAAWLMERGYMRDTAAETEEGDVLGPVSWTGKPR